MSEVRSTAEGTARAAKYDAILRVVHECVSLSNFNAAVALLSGLSDSSLRCAGLPAELIEQASQLSSSVAQKCSTLIVSALTVGIGEQSTVLPFIGIQLERIAMLRRFHTDILSGQVQNMTKRKLLAECIQQLKRAQANAYAITPCPALISSLLQPVSTAPPHSFLPSPSPSSSSSSPVLLDILDCLLTGKFVSYTQPIKQTNKQEKSKKELTKQTRQRGGRITSSH